MSKEKMTEQRAMQSYTQGFDCSQVVLGYMADELEFDYDTAMRIAAGFGGGMWQGEVCGCVSGALMAIGLQYGHDKANDQETKAELIEKVKEFESKFIAQNGSLVCRKLLGYDLSDPEQMKRVMEEQLFARVCPGLAKSACDILDKIM